MTYSLDGVGVDEEESRGKKKSDGSDHNGELLLLLKSLEGKGWCGGCGG